MAVELWDFVISVMRTAFAFSSRLKIFRRRSIREKFEDDWAAYLAKEGVGLEQGRLRDRLTVLLQCQDIMLLNKYFQRFSKVGARGQEIHNSLPNGNNGNIRVQINIELNDNVDTERAQNVMNELRWRGHHRAFEIAPDPGYLLMGSKLIRAYLDIFPSFGKHAQQLQAEKVEDLPESSMMCDLAEKVKDLAEAATMLDENATLQIGGLSLMYKDESGGLTMSTFSEMDVPVLSKVTNFQGRALLILGCFLSGCDFKATTRWQCTMLTVFKKLQLEDGLEVVFARIPQANELFLDDLTYIHAYKAVNCGAKQVIVRSELMRLELIKTSQRPSRPDIWRQLLLGLLLLLLSSSGIIFLWNFVMLSILCCCGAIVISIMMVRSKR